MEITNSNLKKSILPLRDMDFCVIIKYNEKGIENMTDIKFDRKWATPNKNTFSIKPICELVDRYLDKLDYRDIVLDPFAGSSPFKSFCITNDLDPEINANFHVDATDFLAKFSCEVDLVLYDPPYSPRQVSEVYKKLGKTVNMQTTQSSYWTKHKKLISKIVRKNGFVITCGWNSGGIGKTNGFEIIEILLVPHGGWHNDTIVTVERKL